MAPGRSATLSGSAFAAAALRQASLARLRAGAPALPPPNDVPRCGVSLAALREFAASYADTRFPVTHLEPGATQPFSELTTEQT